MSTSSFTINAARSSFVDRFRRGSADSPPQVTIQSTASIDPHTPRKSLVLQRGTGGDGRERVDEVELLRELWSRRGHRWWCFGLGAITLTLGLFLLTVVVEIIVLVATLNSPARGRTAWIASAVMYLAAALFTAQVLAQRLALPVSSSPYDAAAAAAAEAKQRDSGSHKAGSEDGGVRSSDGDGGSGRVSGGADSLRDLSSSTHRAAGAVGCCNSVTGVPVAFLFAFASRALWFFVKALTNSQVCSSMDSYLQHDISWRDVLATSGTILNRFGTAFWFTAFTIVGAYWETSSAALEPLVPEHAELLKSRFARCHALLSTPTFQRISGRVGRSGGFVILVLVNMWLYVFFGALAIATTYLRAVALASGRNAFIEGVNVTIQVEMANAHNLRNIAIAEAYGEAAIALVVIVSLVLIAMRLVRRISRASGVSDTTGTRLCCASRATKDANTGDQLLHSLVCRIRLVLLTMVGVAFKPLMFMLHPPPLSFQLHGIACEIMYPWAFYEIPELVPAVALLILITPSCTGAALRANCESLRNVLTCNCSANVQHDGGGDDTDGMAYSLELEAHGRGERESSASFADQPMVYM